MVRMGSCGWCGSIRQVVETASGTAVAVCLLCDWTTCHKCGTPVPPLDVACPQCSCITSAHDPRTLRAGGGA